MNPEEQLDYLSQLPEPGAGSRYVQLIYGAVINRKPDVILELGVGFEKSKHKAISTRAFLLGLKKINKGHLWSCDVYPLEEDAQQTIHDLELMNFWTFICEDDRVLGKKWSKSIDILYVDTSHTYHHTLTELTLFTPYVKRTGLVLLHDTKFSPSGVRSAIDSFIDLNREWKFRELGCCCDFNGNDYGMGELTRFE